MTELIEGGNGDVGSKQIYGIICRLHFYEVGFVNVVTIGFESVGKSQRSAKNSIHFDQIVP